jgi:hypothetical protein
MSNYNSHSTGHSGPRRHPAALFAIAIVLVAALVSGAPSTWGWKAEQVTKDGVLHVMNPAESKEKPVTLKLEEEWRIGGEDDEEIFGVITSIIADKKGNFYMLDSQLNEVKIYSSDGEFMDSIGREGEGPGEFRNPSNIFLVPNGDIGVLQTFPGKIVTLTPGGDPGAEFPLPEIEGSGFRILMQARHAGDKLAVIYALNQNAETSFTQDSILALVDSDGPSEVRLFSQSSTMEFASPKITEVGWDTFRNRWDASPDGRAFSATTFGEYAITVWNSDGKIDRVIHREYPEHKRTAEDKERLMGIYEGFTRRIPIPGLKIEIEDVFNQITQVYAREDGTLWVLSSRGANNLDDGVMGVFDIYDKKGQFVTQVTLKGQGDPRKDGYFFVKDRLFVVTDFLAAMMALQGGGGSAEDAEEEPELMEIISYKLKSIGAAG